MENLKKKQIRATGIQKLIAKRMLASKLNKPCFYLEAKANVTDLMAMRPALRKSLGVKITTNAFYIRTLAIAAQKHPIMLGTFLGDTIKIADSINIGFAVNAPQGLVVPVIKQADQKDLAKIARLEKELTDKARSNTLTLQKLEGESKALSNLGTYGIDYFIGIVPPPTATIRAVGNAANEVIPKDGDFIAQKILTITLAVDHRVINGTVAAEFLKSIVELLQNPQKLL